MSNNYYAGNVIYNNQHKELTIQGNLSAQQMMKIAKDFFAEETEVTEENYEAEVTEKAKHTGADLGCGSGNCRRYCPFDFLRSWKLPK